ncbi:hypothetical protein [Gimesia panareensis]|uniref:Uncharacterized protein n=1 Tax=Gimesia panareensis TaxID=2527978 RepID=A0A518FLN1_9PLAN|nr:hypothetical protein [Gimesia panareensis]QDU49499.1 hypothetical protein Pan110_18370 [Gimesia panareensis]QDV17264.1 hypothetical protein Pan153_18990 [Gimesia panareensis]
MNSDNLYQSFQRLNDFDLESWPESNWPAAQDHFCIQLLEQFNDLEQAAQLSLSRKLLKSSLERPLEHFACRCAKFGDSREDIRNGYFALLFCRSKEAFLTADRLATAARNLGISSRRIRREMPIPFPGFWVPDSPD